MYIYIRNQLKKRLPQQIKIPDVATPICAPRAVTVPALAGAAQSLSAPRNGCLAGSCVCSLMAEQQQMQVVCPQGCSPGDLIAVTALNGQQLQVQIPAGVGPGVPFLINTPSAVPASSLVAAPAPDEDASLLPVTNTAQKPGTKKLVVTAEEPSSPAAKKAAEEKAKADATAADKEKEAAALKEKEAAAAAAVWGDNCCLTRAACKARYQEDLDETETCAGKCCVRKAHYETILIIVSTLVTVLFIVFQFGIRQRMQLTQGMPFPMFLNGTCTCTGADGFSAELCPDVVFTLNISGSILSNWLTCTCSQLI
eukprot:COSAG06_NODE_8810_length_2066_cov_1.181495_2_plen_311_part_00